MTKLVRFKSDTNVQKESWGLQTDEGIRDIGGLLATCPTILDAIDDWENLSTKLDVLIADAQLCPSETVPVAPVPSGGKLICIGLNYRDHAIETGAEIPTEPVVFSKVTGALCGHEDEVELPAVSQQVDFEAELVLVIGKRAWNVTKENADDYIFGYATGHDVSARDWQKGRPGGQWLLGKSFPNFAPLGPYLVPKADVPDPCNLSVSLTLNGELMQDSNTQQLIFNPWELIAHLTQCFVLEPGDVIFTGTPPGVGAARKPPRFLQPGDVCEVSVQGLGTLRNRFVEAKT